MMKTISVRFYLLFLGMSFSLMGMEKKRFSRKNATIVETSPSVSPDRSKSQKDFQGKKPSAARRLNFSDESEEEVEEGAGNSTRLVRKDIPGEMMKVINNPKYNYFYLDSYPVTHTRLIDASTKRVNGGASFSGRFGVHASSMPVLLDGVIFDKNHHAKGLVACEKDPSLGSPGKNVEIHTSANATFKSYHNNEVAAITQNNKELCLDCVNIHNSSSPVSKTKKAIKRTPEKLHVYSSKYVKLGETEARRIEKATNSNAKDIEIVKESMNWNDKSVTNALIGFAKSKKAKKNHTRKATVIVNKTALAGGEKQLSAMSKAGVNVFVAKDMEHAKSFVRKIGSDYYSTIGTNNATTQGDSETNRVFGTNESEFGKKLLSSQKNYIKEKCIPFSQALDLHKAKVAEKKKAKADATKKAREEKKTPAQKRKASGDVSKQPAAKKRKK